MPEQVSGTIYICGKSYPFTLSRFDEVTFRYDFHTLTLEVFKFPRQRYTSVEHFDLSHILQPLPNLFDYEKQQNNSNNSGNECSTFDDCPF